MATHKGTQCLAKCASAPATTWAWKQHVPPPLNLSFKFSYYQTFRKKKAVRIAKPIQLALQKAESTERFSAFSLHVKRRRKVRSCVLPVLLLQHKDMSCGANLYQLYHWGNPMCSEDTPSNLTRICSGKFLKCQNADNLDIFRQCRRKSSSHPSQLQTLLKTACVCTQGVWFKGIDDIHQHLVSLGKLQHMFLFIRSKV